MYSQDTIGYLEKTATPSSTLWGKGAVLGVEAKMFSNRLPLTERIHVQGMTWRVAKGSSMTVGGLKIGQSIKRRVKKTLSNLLAKRWDWLSRLASWRTSWKAIMSGLAARTFAASVWMRVWYLPLLRSEMLIGSKKNFPPTPHQID